MSRPWEPRAMVRRCKSDSSTSSGPSPPGKGGVVISCGPPCQGLTPHLPSTQTRSNSHPVTGKHGNGKNLLYLSGNLHWLLTSPVSFTVLQKHEAKPQNREAQINSRDTRSPPTREKKGWAQFTLLFGIWRHWDCCSSKITLAQVFIYLEIHRGYLPCVVVMFEKLQSSNQGEGKQKQIS